MIHRWNRRVAGYQNMRKKCGPDRAPGALEPATRFLDFWTRFLDFWGHLGGVPGLGWGYRFRGGCVSIRTTRIWKKIWSRTQPRGLRAPKPPKMTVFVFPDDFPHHILGKFRPKQKISSFEIIKGGGSRTVSLNLFSLIYSSCDSPPMNFYY